MNYRGSHRKYVRGTSQYEVYVYGDVVERNGVSYVCNVESTKGYLPEESNSGFIPIGDGLGATGAQVDGGSYT
jgi:hypothetical protein